MYWYLTGWAGFYSYSVFKSLLNTGRRPVIMNIPASKGGAFEMGLKKQNWDFHNEFERN
jgi:hypothetical protein